MDNLFLVKVFVQIISIFFSFFLVLIGFLSLIKRHNRRKPSCIYFVFFSAYYFAYNCLDFLKLTSFSISYTLLLIFTELLLISSLLFVNLYQVAHLQEELGNRVEETSSQINKKQKQFSLMDNFFKSSLYIIIFILFITIVLNSILRNRFLSLINISIVLLINLITSLGCKKFSTKSKVLHIYFIFFVIFNFINSLLMLFYNNVDIYNLFGNNWMIVIYLQDIFIIFSKVFIEISLTPLLIYKLRRIEK